LNRLIAALDDALKFPKLNFNLKNAITRMNFDMNYLQKVENGVILS